MDVSTNSLGRKARLLLDGVEQGEEVTITCNGHARARVVRLDSAPKPAEPAADNELFGLWADRDDLADPQTWVRALRQSYFP